MEKDLWENLGELENHMPFFQGQGTSSARQVMKRTCRVVGWCFGCTTGPDFLGQEANKNQPAVWHASSVQLGKNSLKYQKDPTGVASRSHDRSCRMNQVPFASSHHLLPKPCGSAHTASVSIDGLGAAAWDGLLCLPVHQSLGTNRLINHGYHGRSQLFFFVGSEKSQNQVLPKRQWLIKDHDVSQLNILPESLKLAFFWYLTFWDKPQWHISY